MWPQCPPGRTIWGLRMVLTLVQLISAHVLLSTTDHLKFSRVLCNSPSAYFICNPPNIPCHPPVPPNSPTPMLALTPPNPCCPHEPPTPLPAPDAPWHPCQPLMPLTPPTISQNIHPNLPLLHNTERPTKWSGFSYVMPKCPWCPYTPVGLLEASSDQEQYCIRSAWHLVSISVRLTCLFEGTSDASSQGNSS